MALAPGAPQNKPQNARLDGEDVDHPPSSGYPAANLGQVLGKLAVRSLSDPRGPDVVHTIAVPGDWLERGETIELELPRNLTCANCEGGGCDACDRAGAVTLRSRVEPIELVQVSLPERCRELDVGDGKTIVLRIPEHGGFSVNEGVPRGLLMLRVTTASEPDAGVTLHRASAPLEAEPARRELRAPKELVRLSFIIGVCLLFLFLLLLRLSGWL